MRFRFPLFLLFCTFLALSFAACSLQISEPKTPVEWISGTTWAGTDSEGDYYEFYFLSDGVLHYSSPSGFYKNGTWKLDGNSIYMEMNRKYSEYEGTLIGTKIQGSAKNIAGIHWSWSVSKKKD